MGKRSVYVKAKKIRNRPVNPPTQTCLPR